jgi:septal ring factor EnvC (AmiA/AmiB activator)
MLTLLKSKLLYVNVGVLVILLATVGFQHLKLTNMSLRLSVSSDKLESAENVIKRQQSAFDSIAHELKVLNTSIVTLNSDLKESQINYDELMRDIQSLKKDDSNVANYLSTTIPPNLRDRVQQQLEGRYRD